jgi:hypothetical protein
MTTKTEKTLPYLRGQYCRALCRKPSLAESMPAGIQQKVTEAHAA